MSASRPSAPYPPASSREPTANYVAARFARVICLGRFGRFGLAISGRRLFDTPYAYAALSVFDNRTNHYAPAIALNIVPRGCVCGVMFVAAVLASEENAVARLHMAERVFSTGQGRWRNVLIDFHASAFSN